MALLNSKLRDELDSTDDKKRFVINILLPIADYEARSGTKQKRIDAMIEQARGKQAYLLEFMGTLPGVRILNALWLTNSVAVDVDAKALRALLERKDIESIEPVGSESIADLLDEALPQGPPWVTINGVGWGVERIGAPQLWDLGIDGSGIVVAVLDTGVNYRHPDLIHRMWDSRDPALPNHGRDFESGDDDPMDTYGHGTKCAGIIAGDGSSGIPTGVAPGAAIMALKIGGHGSTPSETVFGEATQFAARNGADVISMSLTWKRNATPPWWRRACEKIAKLEICHANSAGNLAENGAFGVPANIGFPGTCPPPWLNPDMPLRAGTSSAVTCGATTVADEISQLSGHGPVEWDRHPYTDYPFSANGNPPGLIKPDLCAPGPRTPSCNPRFSATGAVYTEFAGTSAATAHLAGCMALLAQATRRHHLEPNPARIQEALEETAGFVLGQTRRKQSRFGAGRVNVFKAFQYGKERGWWH